jgi:hypothetical protein
VCVCVCERRSLPAAHLLLASLVERDVSVPLDPVVYVPWRLPVPHHDQLCGGCHAQSGLCPFSRTRFSLFDRCVTVDCVRSATMANTVPLLMLAACMISTVTSSRSVVNKLVATVPTRNQSQLTFSQLATLRHRLKVRGGVDGVCGGWRGGVCSRLMAGCPGRVADK